MHPKTPLVKNLKTISGLDFNMLNEQTQSITIPLSVYSLTSPITMFYTMFPDLLAVISRTMVVWDFCRILQDLRN